MNSFQKILIGINAALIVLVIVLVVLLTKSDKASAGTVADAGDTLNVETPILPKAHGKIMYINVDTFQAKYKFYKKIKTELDAQSAKNEGELRIMQEDFRKVYEQYQGQAELMTKLDAENAQMDLAQREKKIQDREAQISETYTRMAEKRIAEYQERITSYMKRKSAEHDYAYVLAYISNSNILYAQDSLDITNVVVEGMNAEYDATSKK